MTNPEELYRSSLIKDSYFNQMLDCGPFNRCVEIALGYLPIDILDKHKENLAFIAMAHRDGTRVARTVCENREVILLSQHIMPGAGLDEGDMKFRYFIYVVLHETAHAIMKHRSPLHDSLSEAEFLAQEEEADNLALQWFNEYVALVDNPHLAAITSQEIEAAQANSQEAMQRYIAQ